MTHTNNSSYFPSKPNFAHHLHIFIQARAHTTLSRNKNTLLRSARTGDIKKIMNQKGNKKFKRCQLPEREERGENGEKRRVEKMGERLSPSMNDRV